jgi:hypothetical protein
MAGSAFTSPIKHSGKGVGGPYEYRGGTGMMPSAEFAVLHDDFLLSVTTNVPTGWDAAVIDTGATVVTDTTAASATGVLLFDSDGATEGAAIYGEKTMQLTSGKKFWMEMRFKTELADDSDVQFGLSDLTATTNPEDLWTTAAANVVAFGVLDGDATVGILTDASNAGTAVSLGTIDLVSATWHVLAIYYDGVKVHGYVDGQRAVSTSTTIPTGVALAPFFGFRNGSAATTEGQCDYVRVVIER